jgi:tRNA (guanine37-N1)-methyltransferase
VRIDIVTIFPGYLSALDLSLVGKARTTGLLDLRVHDLREWTSDRHRTVDDAPLGGGAGMVMRPDVWGLALDAVLPAEGLAGQVELIVPTPSGEPLNQRTAERLAMTAHLVIACGRYEGIDARVAEHYRTRVPVTELSLGDYVLGGGEVAALVLVEAVARLLPGVVGNPESLTEESHGATGLLEYPVYTRPPLWRDQQVPEVLLSGHHARIERWRRDRALERTASRRPDLLLRLTPADLDARDREVLAAFGWLVTDHAVVAGVVAQRPVDPPDDDAVVTGGEPVAD